MPGSFFDTNVLLYVASGDRTKADRAERLIRGPRLSKDMQDDVVLEGRFRVVNPDLSPSTSSRFE